MVTSPSGWQPFYYQSPQVITAFDIHYLIADLGQFALMGHEVHQVHAPVQTPNGLAQANVTGLNAMKNTCVCKCPSTPATCLPPIRSNCHLIIYHLHHSGPAIIATIRTHPSHRTGIGGFALEELDVKVLWRPQAGFPYPICHMQVCLLKWLLKPIHPPLKLFKVVVQMGHGCGCDKANEQESRVT